MPSLNHQGESGISPQKLRRIMTDLQKLQATCYNAYRHALDRCDNPKDPEYQRYGRRGIRMDFADYKQFKSEMWESFLAHIENNPGVRNTQLDRIDNDNNYSRDNCRWVTASENSRNRRSNRIVEYKGSKYCLKEFCEAFDLPYKNTWKRLYARNWPIEKVFNN